jgi:cytochrome c553
VTPNVENGLEIYRSCAMCHKPEGWGLSNGSVPQLAGQHRKVVIKQLADIRAGNRDNLLMVPYSSLESMGGAQAVADVAGYIDTLEISIDTGKGSGKDLELGERLYAENCAKCHGPRGEGNDETFMPRIQSQHYQYLLRQFEWIRDGRRRNANPEMVAQIQAFEPQEVEAILDYVSRLEPPEELQAPPGWHNPDFAAPRNPPGSP